MPHQRLHRGKEARAGGEILPEWCGDFSGGALHPCRLHVKEIPLHQEMVSVTGSVTWISHSPSVIGMNPDPRRQRDERHAHRYVRKGPQEAVDHRHSAGRRMTIPSMARRSRVESPGSPTGTERGPNASETAAYRVEHRVRGEFFLHGFAAVPDNLRVKRKKIPRP